MMKLKMSHGKLAMQNERLKGLGDDLAGRIADWEMGTAIRR
ncbi:MAG: hypothetical protein ACE5OR_00410 [bacterium]